MASIRIAAIIPARMDSQRFPGKPLLELRGLPMIEHVRRRALRCPQFTEVVVATCDRVIADVVARHGGRFLMTSPHHPAASDRVAEAMQQLHCTHVVNVQGDEILVLPSDLTHMAAAMIQEPELPAWNAVAPLEAAVELGDRSIVKCAVSQAGNILYCARDVSPLATVLPSPWEPLRKVLGILGYRRDFLKRYGQLTRTPLEAAEAIDQSRIVEHDVVLRAVEFHRGYPGINEPREIELVEHYLDEDPQQQEMLREICAV